MSEVEMDERSDGSDTVLAEFEHEDGQVTIHLVAKPRALVLEVDGEELTRLPVSPRYSDDVIAHVIELEVEHWAEEEQPLDEIEYNLEQLEYQLKKYGRS